MFKLVIRSNQNRHFCPTYQFIDFKNNLGTFCISALRYLQVDWTGVGLTDNMEHIIKLTSKGQILSMDNDLKQREPQQI